MQRSVYLPHDLPEKHTTPQHSHQLTLTLEITDVYSYYILFSILTRGNIIYQAVFVCQVNYRYHAS